MATFYVHPVYVHGRAWNYIAVNHHVMATFSKRRSLIVKVVLFQLSTATRVSHNTQHVALQLDHYYTVVLTRK